MSVPLIKYVLIAAFRDRLILSLLLAILVSSFLSLFLGSSAIIEKDQFILIFTASSLRIVSILGIVLFVVFFIRRSFEARDIEFLLSRPVSRLKLIFSYGFAFSIISIVVGLVSGIAIYCVTPHLFGYGHVLWVVSIIVENVIMANVALFFSMYISSSTSASLVTLGFYVLSRMMGQLLGIIDSNLVDDNSIYSIILQLVSFITPRLDLIGQSSWLIYGIDDISDLNIAYIILQLFIFPLFVLLATSADFYRRQF